MRQSRSSKAKQSTPSKPRRSEAFKQEALALAKEVGVAQAARDLGVYESQIYQWRSKAAAQSDRSERESQLLSENARQKKELAQLREELAIVKKAAAYFAKHST